MSFPLLNNKSTSTRRVACFDVNLFSFLNHRDVVRLLSMVGGLLLVLFSEAQNVGIGTTTPTLGRLQVNGAVGSTVAIFGDSIGVSAIMGAKPAIGYSMYYNAQPFITGPEYGYSQGLDMATGAFSFEKALSGGYLKRLSMWQGGNVSINTIENNSSLFVVNKDISTTTALFRGTNYNSAINLVPSFNDPLSNYTYLNGGKPNSKVYINDLPLGNVYFGSGKNLLGINTIYPTAALSINQLNKRGMILVAPAYGYNNWEFAAYKNLTDNAADMYMFYNGNYKGNFFYLDGLYYKASDRRMKADIQDIPPVLNTVLKLDPVEYEMTSDNTANKKSIGFLAQQVKEHFPELVYTSGKEETGYKFEHLEMLNYDGFGILAIKSIQEQQLVISNLQMTIHALKQQLSQLKEQLHK